MQLSWVRPFKIHSQAAETDNCWAIALESVNAFYLGKDYAKGRTCEEIADETRTLMGLLNTGAVKSLQRASQIAGHFALHVSAPLQDQGFDPADFRLYNLIVREINNERPIICKMGRRNPGNGVLRTHVVVLYGYESKGNERYVWIADGSTTIFGNEKDWMFGTFFRSYRMTGIWLAYILTQKNDFADLRPLL